MMQYFVKIFISVMIILAADWAARKSGGVWTGLILSLPLTSLIGLLWIYWSSRDLEKLATTAVSTFWFVLIPLPSLLLLAFLWQRGVNFWLAFLLGLLSMLVAYLIVKKMLQVFGYQF